MRFSWYIDKSEITKR